MSCFCEGNKKVFDLQSMRELAKKSARMDGCLYVLYLKKDGTYGFCREEDAASYDIKEYIYPR